MCNNIILTVTVCNASFEVISELQRETFSWNGQCVDNSCKRRAEYLCCSLVIVCRECGQWQSPFIWEKSVCPAEVSVTEHILREFPNSRNPGKTEHAQCVPRSFLPAHAWAWERGWRVTTDCIPWWCRRWSFPGVLVNKMLIHDLLYGS